MGEHFDDLEVREPAERERALFEALPRQLANARSNAPGFARTLTDVEPDSITDRTGLARLPLVRKSDLVTLQARQPPFGGLTATPLGELARVFASPGPIFEPEARRSDYWRMARALHAAGLRRGQLVHNSFSYHLTPAGAMLESGAQAIGCAVFPAGVGQTEAQLQAMVTLRPHAYVGTPSFLRILLDKAVETGADVSSVTRALVSGEALPETLRDAFTDRGVRTLQCYATADLGLIAYESEARQGMIVDEGIILEIVRPGTGEPVPPGDVGEVVVTTLNPDYPLIRFATGDLSAVLSGESPCGRTNMRIKGWLGRADQTAKVRGMFVHPSQVASVVRRHSEIKRARLVIDRRDGADTMTLHCELDEPAGEGLRAAIVASIREICGLRGEVELVVPGTLPNDGKVIEDLRDLR